MPPRKTSAGSDPLAHLAEGPRPIYMIDGEERVLVDEAIHAIRSKTLSRAPDFNSDTYVAREASLDAILAAARTLPVFAPRRLVLVRDADKFLAEDTKRLIAYFEDPAPETVLVLVGLKFDGKTSFYKNAQKHGTVLRFPHPHEREMPGLIRERAKRRGIQLEDKAVGAIVSSVGADLSAALSALEKLSIFAGQRIITTEDVEDVVSQVREQSVFALTDAVGVGDAATALDVLYGSMGPGRSQPLALLGAVSSHWRRLVRVRSMLDAGASPRDVENDLGAHPFVAQKAVDQARGQTAASLLEGQTAIAQADRALKGSRLEADHVMERLVLVLGGGSAGRSRRRRA